MHATRIITTCAWNPGKSRDYACYASPTHSAIDFFISQSRESLYITDQSVEKTLQRPYSYDALRKLLAERSGEASTVIGLWNAKYGTSQCIVHLIVGTGPLICSLTVTIKGSIEHLFAMKAYMLYAAEQFDAVRARVIGGDVIDLLVKEDRKTKGGELAYLRRSEIVEVEGFTAQRHGDGVLYVMDRNLAESGVEARAAAILRLQPLYDSLA